MFTAFLLDLAGAALLVGGLLAFCGFYCALVAARFGLAFPGLRPLARTLVWF